MFCSFSQFGQRDIHEPSAPQDSDFFRSVQVGSFDDKVPASLLVVLPPDPLFQVTVYQSLLVIIISHLRKYPAI
jgi:hypothetical protein